MQNIFVDNYKKPRRIANLNHTWMIKKLYLKNTLGIKETKIRTKIYVSWKYLKI